MEKMEGRVNLFGVIPTYRRPERLSRTLQTIAQQTRRPDHVIVVDNSPSPDTQSIVQSAPFESVHWEPTHENLGSCGGYARGIECVLKQAEDSDWIVIFDDDEIPPRDFLFEELLRFGQQTLQQDPKTAAVGLVGAKFDWKRGALVRLEDKELVGAVLVDCLGANHYPLFHVDAIRKVGNFSTQLFFGMSEVEYGLRLRRAGYSLYAHGDLWKRLRQERGRVELHPKPSKKVAASNWRHYYSLRNTIYILRQHGHAGIAARVSLVRGIAKPLVNLAFNPPLAAQHIKLNLRALRDGWRGNMGRTIEPDAGLRKWSQKPSAR